MKLWSNSTNNSNNTKNQSESRNIDSKDSYTDDTTNRKNSHRTMADTHDKFVLFSQIARITDIFKRSE